MPSITPDMKLWIESVLHDVSANFTRDIARLTRRIATIEYRFRATESRRFRQEPVRGRAAITKKRSHVMSENNPAHVTQTEECQQMDEPPPKKSKPAEASDRLDSWSEYDDIHNVVKYITKTHSQVEADISNQDLQPKRADDPTRPSTPDVVQPASRSQDGDANTQLHDTLGMNTEDAGQDNKVTNLSSAPPESEVEIRGEGYTSSNAPSNIPAAHMLNSVVRFNHDISTVELSTLMTPSTILLECYLRLSTWIHHLCQMHPQIPPQYTPLTNLSYNPILDLNFLIRTRRHQKRNMCSSVIPLHQNLARFMYLPSRNKNLLKGYP